MSNELNELNPFFETSVNNIRVLCNLDNAFSFRSSEIMDEFRLLTNDCGIEEIEEKLMKKFDRVIVQRFMKKINLYRAFLFTDKAAIKQNNSECFTVLTLNVIHSCNMRCKYCFEEIEFRKDTEIMSEEIAFKAIDTFITQLNGEAGHIIFTGGEPILNFSLIKKIVNHVKLSNYKMTYMIKTNGTLISEDIMMFLINNEFDIQVSLDGCQEANDRNRVYANQMGTYRDVVAVLDRFMEKGYKNKLSIHGTVTHQTIKYLRDSLGLIHKRYRGVSFEVKVVMDNNSSGYSLTDEDMKEYLRCHLEEREPSVFEDEGYLKTKYICGIGLWHITVDTNGDLYPCYRLIGINEFKMGNVICDRFSKSSHQKLNEIYNLHEKPGCQKCYAINSCTNGCYADKLLTDNNRLCSSYGNKKSIEWLLTDYFSDLNRVA